MLFGWRSEMAEVAASYLDPQGKYFSGFGYSYDSRYDTPGFWDGQGGALAFEMFRLDKGATEIYLQIATSRKYAVSCGSTTRQPCLRMRFMDGNSFLLTETTSVRQGIEVQYSPAGTEVITVIARNTQRGKSSRDRSRRLDQARTGCPASPAQALADLRASHFQQLRPPDQPSLCCRDCRA